MNTRKALEMGGGTILISLPKAWAKKNKITKGATLVVDELSERRLVVRPLEGTEPEPKEMAVEYSREGLTSLMNEVTGGYLLGYDIIRIQGRSAMARDDRRKLKSTIGRLIGLEIMDEDSRKITLQFLIETTALNPEKIVRRMTSIVEGMLKDTIEGLEEHDSKILLLVEERDDELDRLYFLLVRTLRTAAIDPEAAERYKLAPVEILDYRVLASYLESVGDGVADTCRRLSENPPDRKTCELFALCFRKLEEMRELALTSFLSRRTAYTMGITEGFEILLREIERVSSEIARGGTVREAASTIEMIGLMERIGKLFVDIADLALPRYPTTEPHNA